VRIQIRSGWAKEIYVVGEKRLPMAVSGSVHHIIGRNAEEEQASEDTNTIRLGKRDNFQMGWSWSTCWMLLVLKARTSPLLVR
jgi:hypothetical protein